MRGITASKEGESRGLHESFNQSLLGGQNPKTIYDQSNAQPSTRSMLTIAAKKNMRLQQDR